MKKNNNQKVETAEMEPLKIHSNIKMSKILMGSRVCANCGHTKDTYGGKECSKGHFVCHSCAGNHVHCPLCGHTLR